MLVIILFALCTIVNRGVYTDCRIEITKVDRFGAFNLKK